MYIFGHYFSMAYCSDNPQNQFAVNATEIETETCRYEQKWRDKFPTVFDTTGDPPFTVKLKEIFSWLMTGNELR